MFRIYSDRTRQRQIDGVSIVLNFSMRRGRPECTDWLTYVPKPARCVLRRQIDAGASGQNRPLKAKETEKQ